MASTPEGRVKRHVRVMLIRLDRCYYFMPVQRGLGSVTLDYLICVDGRFYAVETKAPGKTLSPRQWLTADAIVAAGGVVLIVRNAREAALMYAMIMRPLLKPGIYECAEGRWEIAER